MKRIAMLLGFSLLILVPILDAQVPLAILTASDGTPLWGPVALLGNTAAVVGGYPTFATYLFVKPAEGWHDMTETAKLTISDGSIPSSVSLFDETVAVLAPGATYVFVRPPGGWTNATETAKLTLSDAAPALSVSVFGDTVALAGSTATYIFVKPPGGWTNMTETAKLTAADGARPSSASIFGNTVAVGSMGAAYVFVRPPTGWKDMNQTARLTSSAGSRHSPVATNASTVVAGGGGCQTGYECSYIFVRPATGWKDMTETAMLQLATDPQYGGNGFGAAVAVSVNGDVVAVGAPCYPVSIDGCGPGAVFLYAKGKSWQNDEPPYATLGSPDGWYEFCDCFGWSVSISGQFGIVGYGWGKVRGEAYIFGPAQR